MPTVCMHCSIRALLAGEPVPAFEETADAHMARLHADRDATQRERAELEAELRRRLAAGELTP